MCSMQSYSCHHVLLETASSSLHQVQLTSRCVASDLVWRHLTPLDRFDGILIPSSQVESCRRQHCADLGLTVAGSKAHMIGRKAHCNCAPVLIDLTGKLRLQGICLIALAGSRCTCTHTPIRRRYDAPSWRGMQRHTSFIHVLATAHAISTHRSSNRLCCQTRNPPSSAVIIKQAMHDVATERKQIHDEQRGVRR